MTGPNAYFREIVAGVAVVTVLCGAAITFPVFGFISFLLLPLPVLFFRIKFGRSAAMIVSAAALLLVSIFAGGITPDTWLMLGMLAQGVLLGEFLECNFTIEKTIACSSGIIVAAGLCLLMVIGNLSGTGGIELVSSYIRNNLETTVAIYRQLDVPEENIRILSESIDRIHYVLVRIMPALSISILVFAAWMNLLLARPAFKFGKLPAPAFGKLNEWKAPDQLVWAVIGCALLMFLPFAPIKFSGLNILIVLMTVYLFQGLGIVSFYFERKNVPLLLRVLIYGVIGIQQFLMILVIGLGFFDTWLNFRRIDTDNNNINPST